MTVLDHLQDQSGRNGQRGDHRQIDAASDDHDSHPQAQNAEDGDVLQQGDHVVGRREARKEKRKANEQHHENAEDDALLRYSLLPHCLEAPRAKHISTFLLRVRAANQMAGFLKPVFSVPTPV